MVIWLHKNYTVNFSHSKRFYFIKDILAPVERDGGFYNNTLPHSEFVVVNYLDGIHPHFAHSSAQMSTPKSSEDLLMFLGLGIYSLQMQKELLMIIIIIISIRIPVDVSFIPRMKSEETVPWLHSSSCLQSVWVLTLILVTTLPSYAWIVRYSHELTMQLVLHYELNKPKQAITSYVHWNPMYPPFENYHLWET